MDGILPGHMDGILPGHMDGVLPGHMDGVLPGHLDGLCPGKHTEVLKVLFLEKPDTAHNHMPHQQMKFHLVEVASSHAQCMDSGPS